MVHTLLSWIPAFTPLSCGPFSLRIRIPNSIIASTASGRDSGPYLAMHIPLSHTAIWLTQLIYSLHLHLQRTPSSGTVNIWFTLCERNQESTLVLGTWPMVKCLLYQAWDSDPQSSCQKPHIRALFCNPSTGPGTDRRIPKVWWAISLARWWAPGLVGEKWKDWREG